MQEKTIIFIIVLAVVLVFAISRCKMSCHRKEGMSHRLPTVRELADNAYSKTQLPDYTLRQKWPMKLSPPKENYHDVYECRQKCANVMGATPHADCVQDCMNQAIGQVQVQDLTHKCSDSDDCPAGSVCITPSYYGGGMTGYCMYSNNPGISRKDLPSFREGFRLDLGQSKYQDVWRNPRACPPDQFFNELMQECQPRFQGVSSAQAVWNKKPDVMPSIFIPGAATAGYGVGLTDPVDVPLIIAGREQKLVGDI
jgi:hypothetical protein